MRYIKRSIANKIIFLVVFLFILTSSYANFTLQDVGYNDIKIDKCTEISFLKPELAKEEYLVFVAKFNFKPLRTEGIIEKAELNNYQIESQDFLDAYGYSGKSIMWLNKKYLKENINKLKICLRDDEIAKENTLLSSSYFYQGPLPLITSKDIDVSFSNGKKHIVAKKGDKIRIFVKIKNQGTSPANIEFNYFRMPKIENFVEQKELFRFVSDTDIKATIGPKQTLVLPIDIKILKTGIFSLPPVSIKYQGLEKNTVFAQHTLQIISAQSLENIDCWLNKETKEVEITNNSQEEVKLYLNQKEIKIKPFSTIKEKIDKEAKISTEIDEKRCQIIQQKQEKKDDLANISLLIFSLIVVAAIYAFIQKT